MVQDLFMSDLQEVLEKTNIEFPRDVDFEEVKEILGYIVDTIKRNSRVNTTFSGHLGISQEERECYVSEVSGLISYLKGEQMGLSGFSLVRSERNLFRNFSGLRFEPPVGYDLDEIDKTELRLYDLTRDCLREYFDNS